MLTLIIVALLSAAAGYGFRGLINKEVKAVGADLKSDATKVNADIKTDIKKL